MLKEERRLPGGHAPDSDRIVLMVIFMSLDACIHAVSVFAPSKKARRDSGKLEGVGFGSLRGTRATLGKKGK